MKNLIKTLIFIFIFLSFLSFGNFKSKISIKINNKKNTIIINGKKLNSFNLNDIKSILGEWDRLEEQEFVFSYKPYPRKTLHTRKYKPYTQHVNTKNYYYIYDKLGIVFQTSNKSFPRERPHLFTLFYKKNKNLLEKYSPKKFYKGKIIINNTYLTKSFFNRNKITFKDKNLSLLKANFYIIRGMFVKRLYSTNGKPFIQFFLDKNKIISGISIREVYQ